MSCFNENALYSWSAESLMHFGDYPQSAYQLQRVIEELTDLKISVIIQTLNLETLNDKGERTPLIDLMVAIIGQLGQMERVQIIERVRSGMAVAKAKGKHCGRPKGTLINNDRLLKKYSGVALDLRNHISIRKVAKIHAVSLGTVQKVRKAMYSG